MTTMHLSPEANRLPFGLDRLTNLIPVFKRKVSFFGLIIMAALVAFELFNFSTTEYALLDLLGELTFLGLRWSVILALAFSGLDFAGIARLLTLDRSRSKSYETWYLMGAWLLAAAMNAMLTWWSVSLVLISHDGLGNEILGREVLVSSVPAFVALLVVLLRILIIGTLTLSGSSLFFTSSREESVASHQEKKQGSTAPARSGLESGTGFSSPAAVNRIPTRSPMTARASRRS